MKFSYTLLSLIATATAVDIRFTDNQSCNGWFAACSNINPGICCSIATFVKAVEFAAVPSSWTLRKSGFNGENCNNLIAELVSQGSFCFTDLRGFRSARYSFVSKKLARSPSDVPTSEECQKVDTFVLEDGTKYPIDHLSDEQIQYLVLAYFYSIFYMLTFV